MKVPLFLLFSIEREVNSELTLFADRFLLQMTYSIEIVPVPVLVWYGTSTSKTIEEKQEILGHSCNIMYCI